MSNVYGIWQLEVTLAASSTPVTLNGWALEAKPDPSNFSVTVSPRNADPAHLRRFQITFPSQTLSSSYNLTFSPVNPYTGVLMTSAAGDGVDTNLNVGIDAFRGTVPSTSTFADSGAAGVTWTFTQNSTSYDTLYAYYNGAAAGTIGIYSARNRGGVLIATINGIDNTTGIGIHAIASANLNGSLGLTALPALGDFDVLRWTVLTKIYNSSNVPQTIGSAAPATTTTSLLQVPDALIVTHMTVQLDITYPNDPDLQVALVSPSGKTVPLFTNVGAAGSRVNFSGTILADDAKTLIQNGAAPFTGRYNPEQPLDTNFGGTNAQGWWKLVITTSTANRLGTLNNWSLSFDKAVATTGLAEPVADGFSAPFRIFTQDPSNALAHSAWTPVGAAAVNDNPNSNANDPFTGRISAIAVDPSDPSGNTVFVGGASGGVWKTTNFLTKDPMGPTYVALSDFGPDLAINIGSIAIFPRNNDPNQSIIFAATGEGPQGTPGVGFLRSMDGGRTWTLLDSMSNFDAFGSPLPESVRQHELVGTTAYKIVVDPHPTPTGDVIVYAALSDSTSIARGGIWRSVDTGRTWQQMQIGQATDVTLDLSSGPIDAVSNPTGNIQTLYSALRGQGVYISPNKGSVWNQITGNLLNDPIFRDLSVVGTPPIPVAAPANTPAGNQGRILLAKPALVNPSIHDFRDTQYAGWLYALVVTPGGVGTGMLYGLFMTKDFGQHWTRIHIPLDTNDQTVADDDVFSDANGNDCAGFAVNPTNPNVVYLAGTWFNGGDRVIRVNTEGMTDPYAFFYADDLNDGGQNRGVGGAITGTTGAAST